MSIDSDEMNRRLIALSESDNIRIWRVDADQLSVPERVFGAIWEFEAQVNNGGFSQYFYNSSGELAPYAPFALREIGATSTAALASEALEYVGGDVPLADDKARRERIGALPPDIVAKLDALDARFFERPDDLTTLLYRYVCSHRGEIGAPADF